MENIKVNIQLFDCVRDNKVKPKYTYELDWIDFVEWCSEPTIVNCKEDAKLISPVEFYPIDDAELTDDGKHVRRCGDNVKQWTMLPIDVDKDMTIKQALTEFKDYEFVMYTSFNHQKPKGDEPPCDRFRLFFLLEHPVNNEDFKCRRNSLKQFVEFLDPTSLSVSRSFYVPSCSKEMYPESLFFHNKGKKLLNVMDFEPEVEPEYYHQTTRELDDTMKQAVLDNLTKLIKVDYEEWWKIGAAMAASDYTFEDFAYVSSVIRGHRPDRHCKAQWSSSKRRSINFGYLVNLLKREIGTDWMPTYVDIQTEQLNNFMDKFNKLKRNRRHGS